MADEIEFGSTDMDSMSDAFMAVATEKLDTRQDRRVLRRIERNGPLARIAMRRAHEQYAEAGGDPGSVQDFMDWLIKNWPAILEMLKSIIALFTVV